MYAKCIKRLIDIFISFIALPFVTLIIVIIAPMIYINDPGPIMYISNRRGLNGKTYRMLKLRSMFVNSPDIRNSDGSTFNSDSDNRITKVGKLIRMTSIDEIPQFFNVLLGDMSLIGPRPMLTTPPYEQLDNMLKMRFSVRPGITGYAQAYYRNSITQKEKFEYDCYYIEHLSFIMDIRILMQTIVSVLRRKQIYVSKEKHL